MTPELTFLIEEAVARYEAMPQVEKARMNYDQRRSWVRGNMMLSDDRLTKEEVDALMDKAEAKEGIVRP